MATRRLLCSVSGRTFGLSEVYRQKTSILYSRLRLPIAQSILDKVPTSAHIADR